MTPTLLVLAAGLSSRYGGKSKQTDGLGPSGETLLDYSVYDARAAGFGRVVFIIRREAEEIFRERVVRHLEPNLSVDLVYQDPDDLPTGFTRPAARIKPWGTGHAVRAARNAIQEPFCVINADDFYGRAAFESMAGFLRQLPQKPEDPLPLAMCGYPLHRTLSAHGKVARGLCRVSDSGLLLSVEELTDIYASGDGAENRPKSGPPLPLTGHETVSMNLWGFPPDVFPKLDAGLAAFLDSHQNDPAAEFYIPAAVDEWLRTGQATCRVLPTDSPWFGITWPEDRAKVQECLSRIVANKAYPTPLWL